MFKTVFSQQPYVRSDWTMLLGKSTMFSCKSERKIRIEASLQRVSIDFKLAWCMTDLVLDRLKFIQLSIMIVDTETTTQYYTIFVRVQEVSVICGVVFYWSTNWCL